MNADLKIENEQLKLLIANLKSEVSNPAAPRLSAQAQPFSGTTSTWKGGGLLETDTPLTGLLRTALPSRSEPAREPNHPYLQTNPLVFSGVQSFYGYPTAAGPANQALSVPPFVQQQGQLQPPHSQPIGISMADFAGLQQMVQMQQRPAIQDSVFLAGATPRSLLGLHENATLARQQQSAVWPQHPSGMDSSRQTILPYPPQPEDMQGLPPLDITSLLVPPGNFQVVVPLNRAIPKRRDPDDTKDDTQEKKKDPG